MYFVLQDTKQVLFKRCDHKYGTSNCDTPVYNIVEKFGCPLHFLPVIRDLGETKEEITNYKEKVKECPTLPDSPVRQIAYCIMCVY